MNGFRNPLAEFNPETESFEAEQFQWGTEKDSEVFNEMGSMELAAELLEVRDEAELNQFLRDLLHKASRADGLILRSPIGQAVASALKDIAKKALPLLPSTGGALGKSIGAGLASMAGRALGLEVEGLSPEDREFEAAKQFVRFAGEAARKALTTPPNVPMQSAVQTAIGAASQRFAPGLLSGALLSRNHGYPRTEKIMHDIDRTQLEMNPEFENFEFEQFAFPGETGSVFQEAEEMELAAELLDVQSEQELDQFLGDLFRKAQRTIGRALRSPTARAIGGALKGIARTTLPIAGSVGGTAAAAGLAGLGVPVPPTLGASIGGSLASAAGQALGLELETLSQEDREFEGARQFVRLGAEAIANAMQASPRTPPETVAQ